MQVDATSGIRVNEWSARGRGSRLVAVQAEHTDKTYPGEVHVDETMVSSQACPVAGRGLDGDNTVPHWVQSSKPVEPASVQDGARSSVTSPRE